MNNRFAGITIQDIVHNYSDTLIRIAFQHTRNTSDAEDIVQEVYIKLIKQIKQFKSTEHLKAWLIRVTINRCKDHFKSSWIQTMTLSPDEMIVFSDEKIDLMAELFELEPEDRNIIYLYYYEGYSIEEIAIMLKKNKNTLSSKLQRARVKLKSILEEERVV